MVLRLVRVEVVVCMGRRARLARACLSTFSLDRQTSPSPSPSPAAAPAPEAAAAARGACHSAGIVAPTMKKRKFYVVAQGRQPGIYDTWEACKSQVDGYRGSQYKSFVVRGEAERYLVESSVSASLPSDSESQQPAEETEPEPDASSYMNQSITFTSQLELEKYLGLPSITSIPRPEVNFKQSKLEGTKARQLQSLSTPLSSSYEEVYQLEYDGASKGNPGAAGAGALLRHPDGSVVCELTERLGIATNNVAEYRALILGLREALHLGIKHIKVQGDSMLVCQQVLGKWAIKSENLKSLCREAKQLTKEFSEFSIRHVDREYNSDADALANKALELPNES